MEGRQGGEKKGRQGEEKEGRKEGRMAHMIYAVF